MKIGYIHTKFWDDPYIQELTPTEKLLFVYLRTNSHFSICGIYEVTLKTISFETGIPEQNVKKMLKKFSENNKIHYHKNYVCVVNFLKHIYKPNDNLTKGIKNERAKLPEELTGYFEEKAKGLTRGLRPPRTITPSPSPSPSPSLAGQKPLGEFKNVSISEDEFKKLIERFGEADAKDRIEKLSTYIASKGKKYKNHYATILSWARNEPASPRKGQEDYDITKIKL